MPIESIRRNSQNAPGGTVRFHDFDQLARMFQHWNGRFEQLSSGKFEGEMIVAQGQCLRVVNTKANQSVLLRGRGDPDAFSLYPVTDDQAESLWQGRRLQVKSVVAHGPSTEVNHRSARRITSIGITLPAKRLLQAAQIVCHTDIERSPPGWAALQVPDIRYESLLLASQQMIRWRLTQGMSFNSAEGHQLEQNALLAVVELVFPSTTPAHRCDASLPARNLLVRQAEDLMRANLHEPLGAIDLCQQLGASERTLRLAFKERFGVGPMIYYKTIRLNAVRSNLKASREDTVADIARSWGFQHLGNFAADYRRVFGERPSSTHLSRNSNARYE